MPSFATIAPTTKPLAAVRGHTRRSGAEYGSPPAGFARGSAATSPEVAEPTQTFTATRGGSPRVASTAARYAAGGTAPGTTGVCMPGATTTVEVVRGSASTAGGVVEVATQAPGPAGMHMAGPGAKRRRRLPASVKVIAVVVAVTLLTMLADVVAGAAGNGFRSSAVLAALAGLMLPGQIFLAVIARSQRRPRRTSHSTPTLATMNGAIA